MGKKKNIYVLSAVTILMLTLIHVDIMDFGLAAASPAYEQFGPRVKNVIFKFYSSLTSLIEALKAGEIDIADATLPPDIAVNLTQPPHNEYINVVAFNASDMIILDINNNETLPNGEPNPCHDPIFRHALAHLVDREYAVNNISKGFANPLHVPIPLSKSEWINWNCWNAHPYNPMEANRILDEAGYIDWDGNGIRNMPNNGPDVVLDVVIRVDHEQRKMLGDKFCSDLMGVGIGCNCIYVDSAGAYERVMVNKDFHVYTGAWEIGDVVQFWLGTTEPTYHCQINDPILRSLIENAYRSLSICRAVYYMKLAQQRFIEINPILPVLSSIKFMAHRKYYGRWVGEEQFWDREWQGIICKQGVGVCNFWTFLNVHPEGYEAPSDANFRCGVLPFPKWGILNPIYGPLGSSHHCSDAAKCAFMNLIYENLITVNPFWQIDYGPWITYQWDIGAWSKPEDPTVQGTYVTLKIRDDVYWHDGVKMTVEDIRWMIVDMIQTLEARGFPRPWWYNLVAEINHVETIDEQTIKIYYNAITYKVLEWAGFLPLIPKHVWEPIVETGDPTVELADPNATGNGPFKLVEYQRNTMAVLTRNDEYFNHCPVRIRYVLWEWPKGKYNLRIILYNYKLDPRSIQTNVSVIIGEPPPYTEKEITITSAFQNGFYPGTAEWILKGIPRPILILIQHTPILGEQQWTCEGYRTNIIPEDINCDGVVNIKDAVLLGAAFGSKPCNPNWDSRADLVIDGYINVKDAVKLGAWFGWPNVDC
ncbi:MAG: ABC transporter substrate-binding protein [Candidatus Bathyarchaeia archaeon]